MEPCYIKHQTVLHQEQKMDMCINFEQSHEFDFNSIKIKTEYSNCGFFNESIKYNFYTDNYDKKNLLTDNFLSAIIKQEPEPESSVNATEVEESEDEDFELRLSDTSADGEDDAKNEPLPDLRAVTNKLKDAKIDETPSDSNTKRRKAPSKVDKAVIKETPKRKNMMKQTSLLSYLKLKESSTVESKRTPRSRTSKKVKSATPVIDPIEMKKIMSAKVVLEKLPAVILHTPSIHPHGKSKIIHRLCVKCNKEYPNLATSSNSRCSQCSEAIAFRCGQCNKIYHSQSGIRRHLDSQCLVSNEEFRCTQCDFVSTVKGLLLKHKRWSHKGKVNGLIKMKNITTNEEHRATPGRDKDGSHDLGEKLLVQPYCATCKNSTIKSKIAKKCSKCKTMLSFQCITCQLILVTKKEAQSHVKIHARATPKAPQNLKKRNKACVVK